MSDPSTSSGQGRPPPPQIDVTLGGKTYDLKPTFGCLSRIEGHLGVGIGVLLMRYLEGKYGAVDVTRIVYEGIVAEAGNDAPEFTEVGRLIVEEGIESAVPAALSLLNAALVGFAKFSEDADKGDDEGDDEDGADGGPTPPRG